MHSITTPHANGKAKSRPALTPAQRGLPFPPQPPAEATTHYCAGCDQFLPPAEMHDMTGYQADNPFVCRSCWSTFTPYQRVYLTLRSTPTMDGGLDCSMELDALEEMGRKRFFAEHGHDFHGACEVCSPHEHQQNAERRAEARRKGQQR